MVCVKHMINNLILNQISILKVEPKRKINNIFIFSYGNLNLIRETV